MQELLRPKSWYHTEKKFLPSEVKYCALLEEVFMVRDPLGKAIPYIMTDYQKEWHAQSLNIKQESAQDLLIIKARGISFTFSMMIDYIMTGCTMQNQLLPVIAQRFETAKDIVKVAAWLIVNSKLPELKDSVEIKETEIKFKNTGSIIRAYPSASAADAIRGSRLLRALLDEFAFQSHDKQLLAAVQDCMQSEYGQIILGSTPNGRQNYFFDIVNKPIGFLLFRFPVFDEHIFVSTQSIMTQDVIPIAPWIDKEKLEIKRQRDINIFMQENMCSFLDDSLSFFSYSLCRRCENPMLLNFAENLRQNPFSKYETPNPMIIGVDVARTTHLTAISGFEVITNPETHVRTYIQRFLTTIQNMEIPKQVDYIKSIIESIPSILKIRIDQTGLGLGLCEYLKREYPHRIEGINFSGTIKTGETLKSGHGRAKIREYMCVNMKGLMESNQVQFIPDDLQIKHMTSMTYAFDVEETTEGHGDILFANALALLPFDYTHMFMAPLVSNISLTRGLEKENTDPNKMTLNEKINWLKYQNRPHRFGLSRE